MNDSASSAPAAVFFDLGDTLGSATVDARDHRLIAFDVFPYVSPLLHRLRAAGVQLGVISNTGVEKSATINAVLEPTGLLRCLDPHLLLYSGDEGITKASPSLFERAAARAGVAPTRCVFVGENAGERHVAERAKWRVCSHPLLAEEVLAGHAQCYIRMTLPGQENGARVAAALRDRPVVPQHVAGGTVYALTSRRAAIDLEASGITIQMLGDAGLPDSTDLFLLHAGATGTGSMHETVVDGRASGPEPPPFLLSSAQPEGIVVAIGPGQTHGIDAVHLGKASHGHTLKLTPDWLLLEEPAPACRVPVAFADRALPDEVLATINRIEASGLLRTVERYAGIRPLDGSPRGVHLRTRHTHNEQSNALAVAQLVEDLRSVGGGALEVRLHRFDHRQAKRHNVEAELAGSSSDVVLVTAHLDSTAGNDGLDIGQRRAPGADDDASGMAAVLSIAACLVEISRTRKPVRTVRFVLFNGEEQGMVGSAEYARRSKTRGETVVAVFQMDMIGFNASPPMTWEIHAATTTPGAVEPSRQLADLLAHVAPIVASELGAPQIYAGASVADDPALGRSDHASFQAQGFPACVVTEDMFGDPDASEESDANPHYHREGDAIVDPVYIAAIAKVVAAAAWLAAT